MSDTLLALAGPFRPRIDAAGFGPLPPGHRRERRPICDHLLTLVEGGRFTVEARGEEHRGEPHCLWWVQPREGHRFRFDAAENGRVTWIHLSLKWLPGWDEFDHQVDFGLHRPGRKRFLQPRTPAVWGVDLPPVLSRSALRIARRTLRDLVGTWLEGHDRARIEADARLGILLHEIVDTERRRCSPEGDDAERRLHRAEAFARRRMGRDVSVTDLARIAGYHRSHFTPLFRERRGRTPQDFLRALRIREATVLLATQDLPIAEVGRAAGYDDPTVFSRAFAAVRGCSPRAWRDSNREG